VFRWVIAIALLGGMQVAGAATRPPVAKPSAIVTILEGRASVIRGLSQFDAAEGVRLVADDLLRTGEDTFLRIEYEDGTSLELGPQTLLQLNHPARKRANRPALYLLAGWLKLSSARADSTARGSLASPGMDLVDLAGVVVVRSSDAAREVFAEQGSARCIDRSSRAAESIAMNSGDFVVAEPDAPPKLQGRPAADFLSALPRPYYDTLPSRYERFKTRVVMPKGQGAFAYADVERWINAEPSIRRQFVVLWHAKAANPAFRAALDRDLPMHPEWDPVLHPERYEPTQPQPGPAVANPASPPTSRHAEADTPLPH
jgi:FecR protein